MHCRLTVLTTTTSTSESDASSSVRSVPPRKAMANNLPEDPNGYGPNWSNVDDYDIPTVLRKQMD